MKQKEIALIRYMHWKKVLGKTDSRQAMCVSLCKTGACVLYVVTMLHFLFTGKMPYDIVCIHSAYYNAGNQFQIGSSACGDTRYFEYRNVYRVIGNWAGSIDKYTTEDTIKKDIVYTMRREGIRKLEGAPAWGVSTDERIASMTINAKPVDDVIMINEVDGKRYYFWIIMDVEEIKTNMDVKTAEIEMNDLQ